MFRNQNESESSLSDRIFIYYWTVESIVELYI